MLLTGEYHHQVDEKGRIRIPAKLKEALGESPMILKGTDGCLFVYSQEDAKRVFEAKFEDSDYSDEEKTKVMRMLFASAYTGGEDKQGRILLPQSLIDHAGLQKNVVTIGAFDRVEIWSEEKWNAYADLDAEDYDKCLKKLSEKKKSV